MWQCSLNTNQSLPFMCNPYLSMWPSYCTMVLHIGCEGPVALHCVNGRHFGFIRKCSPTLISAHWFQPQANRNFYVWLYKCISSVNDFTIFCWGQSFSIWELQPLAEAMSWGIVIGVQFECHQAQITMSFLKEKCILIILFGRQISRIQMESVNLVLFLWLLFCMLQTCVSCGVSSWFQVSETFSNFLPLSLYRWYEIIILSHKTVVPTVGVNQKS